MPGVEVGVGYVDIRPDMSKFGRQLKQQMGHDMAQAGADAGQSLKSSLTNAAKGAAKAFGAAFAAVKVKDFLGDAISAATDLQESLSKSNTVFGTSAVAISSWAENTATSIGLSRREALDAAGAFGNMFSQLGFGANQTADMSKQIVALAADFASFHNADITDVITAQQAAFRGEYDSLQRFLPVMNAATIEQEALRQTGKKTTNQLTAQEKALAAYTLMFSGAGDAMGDFARTSESAANQQRILSAEWTNAKTELGENLLPIMKSVVGFINDELLPAFRSLFGLEGTDPSSWSSKIREAFSDTFGFILGALQQTLRGLGNAFDAIPFGWGDSAAKDLRKAADELDRFRDIAHASTAELLEWSNATLNADMAAKLLAPSTQKVTAAVKDSIGVTKDSASATRDAAAAQRDLLGARREIADAERGLSKAQVDRDKAAAAFAILGTDTAREELADADEDLADARDHLADARDREADVLDRIGKLDEKSKTGTSTFVSGFNERTGAVKLLNNELGITQEKLTALQGDAGNILGRIDPAGGSGGGDFGFPIPPPPTATPGSFGINPSGNFGLGAVNVPKVDSRTINITNNFAEPVPDPTLVGKAVAWVL